MSLRRSSGILLHPTSLPGPYGIGELGSHAHRFVDWLAASGQRVWQVMPLGPTGYGDSPYQCFSAYAGNPYLISLERLAQEGWLTDADLAEGRDLPDARVDYGAVIPFKVEMLSRAERRFAGEADADTREAFAAFERDHAEWLDDYALFMALKDVHGGRPWNEWDEGLRDRDPAALDDAVTRHADAIRRHRTWQYWFHRQWLDVKAHANAAGIEVVGDLPIFIAYDSVDAWANRELFFFDDEGRPTVVAGVPPDYFSATGQRWGNPLYRWSRMKARGYAWWISRFRSTLEFVDVIRVDHFRGFEAYWEIPASEPTAVEGRWVRGPGQPFFDAVQEALGELPIIAEDLGVITPAVEQLRDANGLPGMKVLQFAFAGDASDPYLPHNYGSDFVVYTGTHDNDTTRGWYETAPESERDHVRRYLARSDANIAFELIRLAQASVADLAVYPLQDTLSLGSEARMNTPGKPSGNWTWRFAWDDLPDWLPSHLNEMARLYGRSGLAEATDTPYRQSVTTKDVEDDRSEPT
ncbi:MAG: 4-alpha-glucanotransferase [Trueperaceae bacterium]|nr:4-alpha-glucanotransferase [Trueperaceae bacterium]